MRRGWRKDWSGLVPCLVIGLCATLFAPVPGSAASKYAPQPVEAKSAAIRADPNVAPPPAERLACQRRLADLSAEYTFLPDIQAGACSALNIVRLTRLGPDLTLKPAATVTCAMAERLGDWVKTRLVPAAQKFFGEAAVELSIGASYVCRNENNQPAGKLSEHASADAIDLTRVVFKTHALSVANLPQGSQEHAFFDAIRSSACLYFSTVLGPGSDPQHADNLHLDLRQRRNGYRICQ
jgi:hypothetical protein